MNDFLTIFAAWLIPLLLLFIPLIGLIRGVKVYEAFVEGASEGFSTVLRIMPYLVAMMVAIAIFRDSGALAALAACVAPWCSLWGIPEEILPLALLRPLSGSGALGMTAELIHRFGPDSFVGYLASVIIGSTDTTFYVLTVYFGAVGVKNPRYSLFVGLCGDVIGLVASLYVCQKFFL
ncbi:MAG: spore maturation protein [Sporomusaceae bacterium]|nr:spore maturation protein [Sporomusaceae bacterium]